MCSLVFFLTVLLRFIQEIEMTMGPGQAKQCQLRAFLTYYINDLFLNQVCKIQARQVDTQQLIWVVYIWRLTAERETWCWNWVYR